MEKISRRGFLRGAAGFVVGAAAVGCGPLPGEEPFIVEVPDGFDGSQFDLFRRFAGSFPAADTEFFLESDSGWLRPDASDFWTLDAGVWRQAMDGDQGESSWLFYPLPGERVLFAPIGEHVA